MHADRSQRLTALRELLAEKFPAAELKPGGVLPTGVAAIDEEEGGLRRGAVTELNGSASGGALFIDAMMAAVQRERCFAALVDGGFFDPQGAAQGRLCRWLWVACPEAKAAVKAADLLLRDGNLSVVLLDLQLTPLRELQRIPASTWHRFQFLVESTSTVFVILTPYPLVESARVRIAVRSRWGVEAQRMRRAALIDNLDAQVFARRDFSGLRLVEATETTQCATA